MEGAETRGPSLRIKHMKTDCKSNDGAPVKLKKWTEEEVEKLLHSIKLYGHKDLDSLEKELPQKNKNEIKKYLLGVHSVARTNTDTNTGLNYWLSRTRSVMAQNENTNINDYYQIGQVLKFLSVDGLLEKHPPPEICDGIDFVAAYRLLYQALMGYPLQPVNKATFDFLYECLCSLNMNKSFVSEMAEFIKKEFSPGSDICKTGNSKNSGATSEGVSSPFRKKPKAVYQRKKPTSVSSNDTETPSMKVVLEDRGEDALGGMKCYSVEIEGREMSTALLVSVPYAPREQRTELEGVAADLVKNAGYNPFKIPHTDSDNYFG